VLELETMGVVVTRQDVSSLDPTVMIRELSRTSIIVRDELIRTTRNGIM
jgi:hypothetical protein